MFFKNTFLFIFTNPLVTAKLKFYWEKKEKALWEKTVIVGKKKFHRQWHRHEPSISFSYKRSQSECVLAYSYVITGNLLHTVFICSLQCPSSNKHPPPISCTYPNSSEKLVSTQLQICTNLPSPSPCPNPNQPGQLNE